MLVAGHHRDCRISPLQLAADDIAIREDSSYAAVRQPFVYQQPGRPQWHARRTSKHRLRTTNRFCSVWPICSGDRSIIFCSRCPASTRTRPKSIVRIDGIACCPSGLEAKNDRSRAASVKPKETSCPTTKIWVSLHDVSGCSSTNFAIFLSSDGETPASRPRARIRRTTISWKL